MSFECLPLKLNVTAPRVYLSFLFMFACFKQVQATPPQPIKVPQFIPPPRLTPRPNFLPQVRNQWRAMVGKVACRPRVPALVEKMKQN